MSGRPGLIRRVEYAAMLTLSRVLRALSPRRRVAIGRAIGRLGHALDRPHRALARESIVRSLGVDDAEARRIARRSFEHFGRLLAETLTMPSYAGDDADPLFAVEGLEHLAAAHARGRGVLVFSAHIGNWELIALRQARAGYPMDLIARPLDNPWLEEAFKGWRQVTGNRVLGKRGALRGALRSLRAGRCLAILIDQNTHSPPRLFLPFFGRLAATTPTLGTLALRLDAPIVPVISWPTPDGGYRIVYEPALPTPSEGSDDERVREITRRATEKIEDWIREQPETWLWLHNRWKSQPNEGELAG